MNDLSPPNWNSVVDLNPQDRPAVEREIENPSKHRLRPRRRWGGRLFSLGGLLALASGLALGTWGDY
jgi:hypothetical protein